MIIQCPLPAALRAIVQPSCEFRFDQIVRMILQRRQPTATPPFPTLTAAQTLTTYTGFMGATDNTKVVTTPIFTGLVIPASEALTTGGNDNSTFAGIRQYNGEGAVTPTGQFRNIPPATKRSLDWLTQESVSSATGVSNLTAIFVNKDGVLFMVNPAPGEVATTNYLGVPIYNFRVSSPGSEGFNSSNIHNFSFDLMANWADYLVAIKPNFDPLTDLVAA